MAGTVGRSVVDDRDRVSVVLMLAKKLPRDLAELANPVDERCQLALSLSLEPWLTIVQPRGVIELHVREDGNVEFRVAARKFTDARETTVLRRGNDTLEEFAARTATAFAALIADAAAQG